MANLGENNAENYNWNEDGIYQLEITDPVEGGAGGIANRQAEQLALRTRNLHTRVGANELKLADVQEGSTAVGTVRGGVDAAYDSLAKLFNWVNAQFQAIGGGEELTGAVVRDMLQGLAGNNRLDISAIKGIPPFEGSLAIAASEIDWSLSPVRTKTLTANTTFTFSNLRINQVITLELTGNFIITWPGYVKVAGGEYDGTVANLVQLLCINNTPGSESVWCIFNKAV